MAKMFNPPHPAAILREDVLPALGLTVTQAARQLGVSRVALSRVLNERTGRERLSGQNSSSVQFLLDSFLSLLFSCPLGPSIRSFWNLRDAEILRIMLNGNEYQQSAGIGVVPTRKVRDQFVEIAHSIRQELIQRSRWQYQHSSPDLSSTHPQSHLV
jgi:hypothetical protein